MRWSQIFKRLKQQGFIVKPKSVKKLRVSDHFSECRICWFSCLFVWWEALSPAVCEPGHAELLILGLQKHPNSTSLEWNWQRVGRGLSRLELQTRAAALGGTWMFWLLISGKGHFGSFSFLGTYGEFLKLKGILGAHWESRQIALFQTWKYQNVK